MSQLSLAVEAPQRPKAPLDQRIRARLDAMLDQLRGVDALPWTEEDLRRWRVLVPQMTDRLPAGEAAAVRQAFDEELTRLGVA